MPCKGGETEVNVIVTGWLHATSIHPIKGNNMGETGRKREHPQKDDGKSTKPPPVPVEDDDIEDGDIATPKRDRDDEQD